jgi:hypothetical protein|tara:strand:- start:6918 stop:7292 length:375 start_codon:yes stop_codon:yes gene_type:complete
MGVNMSTTRYALEHSFLPTDHKSCCIPLYDYEYFIATSPCKFIYKEIDSFKPKWIYYKGYIGDITKDGLLSIDVCDIKLESKGIKFDSLLELTEFIKGQHQTNLVSKVNSTFTFVDNNYINQMV